MQPQGIGGVCWSDCPRLNWIELGGGARQGWWGKGGAPPGQMAEYSSGWSGVQVRWGPQGLPY